jgi:AraC-like DNA-binding protein
LTNTAADLRDLNVRLARAAAAAAAAPSLDAFISALHRALVSAVEGQAIDRATARAVHMVERSGGCASIERVCEEAGLRARDLERRFARDVGLTPKGFSRIVRFQRAVRALESGQPRLIDAALSAGYYDQPHFTREFTAIARTPPTRWLSGGHELARYFTSSTRERGRR